MDLDLLVSLKALSDASRLRIVGLLAAGRQLAVEDLAAALDLTPGTVVHHLKRLRDAGLVESRPRPPYVDYSLRLERLAQIGAELGRLSREQEAADGIDMGPPEADWARGRAGRVLHSFFEGGRLLSIPAQHAKRLVVLRFLAETVFEDGREYSEKEVNALLVVRHQDVASLRRYLVDEGFMRREAGVYQLLPRVDWPPLEPTA
ncbi:MAG TPA: metalloregulator ArsR/SmtB family transcription factor [Candidatus Limnocylindria bacterium]|nr:metalloregulator ArsR/SmtB family transcription factor [Candidatus Limnocylindria bacterium]